jgi:ABC-type transport system substrate-binding protein
MLDRRQALTLAAVLGLSSTTAFRSFAQSATTPSGSLTFGSLGLLANLDPHVVGGTVWRKTLPLIYDRLLGYDAAGKLVGLLAESWSFASPTELAVALRRGVTFHGGQAFSAADVVASFERIRDPAAGASLRATVQDVKVAAKDAHTVVFTLPEPSASFPNVLAVEEAAIVSKDWLATKPNLALTANGTGPFKLEQFDPKVETRLVRNDAYYVAGLPKLQRIVQRAIADDSARVNALKTGAVDLIDTVPWNQIAALKEAAGITVVSAAAAMMDLWFNTADKTCGDPRIRRAISYAIDREAISKVAFFGYGKPLYGPPTPAASEFYHADLAKHFSYDVARAKQLLAEAGVKGPLAIEFIVSQAPTVYMTIAQIVAANLAQIGINAKIVTVDFPTVLARKNSGNYQMLLYGVSVQGPDPDIAYTYYFGPGTGYWAAGAKYEDATVAKLLAAGRSETDPAKRSRIYHDLEAHLLETSPWVFMTWRDDAVAFKSTLMGYADLDGALAVPAFWISAPQFRWT